MFLTPEEIKIYHEERVKYLQDLARPIRPPKFVKRIWASLRTVIRKDGHTNHQPDEHSSHLTTQELAAINSK